MQDGAGTWAKPLGTADFHSLRDESFAGRLNRTTADVHVLPKGGGVVHVRLLPAQILKVLADDVLAECARIAPVAHLLDEVADVVRTALGALEDLRHRVTCHAGLNVVVAEVGDAFGDA